MKQIKFYNTRDEYGCFSNFSKHPVIINGTEWPTSEHYYQAQKFTKEGDLDLLFDESTSVGTRNVYAAKTPGDAADIGRDPRRNIRKDWDAVKDTVMAFVVGNKVAQHKDVYEKLMSTVGCEIIEDSPTDYYWGCGSKGTGKNKLGKILMGLRDGYITLNMLENEERFGEVK